MPNLLAPTVKFLRLHLLLIYSTRLEKSVDALGMQQDSQKREEAEVLFFGYFRKSIGKREHDARGIMPFYSVCG